MGRFIKGIAIELGGETQKLGKALADVEKQSRDLQAELRHVERLLKLDPKNTELLAQKQKLLADAVESTKKRLDTLKTAQEQAAAAFAKGEIGEQQYRALQREVIATEERLKSLETQLSNTNNRWNEVADGLEKFGKKATDVGKDLTKKVTAPIVGAGAVAFKFASDLEDAMGAADQIFGKEADNVKKWARELENYYGIAETEALTYANTMGAMLQNIGKLNEREAAKQAQTLVRLAGDLTAMFGGTTQSAVQALTNALKGNMSMLDNYGMGVNEATIKAKAMEMGLMRGRKEMDLATKQAATLALIMEQTADAQGQAAREADSASGSMRGLLTELKNIAGQLGQIILPAVTPFIRRLKEMVEAFGRLPPGVQKTIVVIAGLAAAVGPLLIVVGQMATGLSSIMKLVKDIKPLMAGLKAAFGALTSPIGLTVAAIAAAIAIGVLLVQNWDKIKETAEKVFTAVGKFISETVEKIKGFFTGLIDKGRELIDKFKNIGKDIVEGIWEGIKSMWQWLTDKVKGFFTGLVDGIKKLLGISSPSKLFADVVGANMAAGIEVGFGKRMKEVSRSISSDLGSMTVGVSAGQRSASSGGTVVAGGYGTANIIVEVDGRTLVRAVGQPLVDTIRLKTGMRR